MSAGSRNNKNSPGHSPVTYMKMVEIFCFLLKIHPCRQRILGGGVCVVVVADVNAECDADGQQNGQQPEKNSAGKRFFFLVLHRTPLFYKHFPQSLQPLQINLLPQVSQFARKWGVYKSSCGMGYPQSSTRSKRMGLP